MFFYLIRCMYPNEKLVNNVMSKIVFYWLQFDLFNFLFLLFTLSFFKSKFFQSFLKFSQLVFLFLILFFLFGLLFSNWLSWFWLGFLNLLLLFLLFAFFISEIEWVSDGIKLEFLLFEFFRFESTLYGFHVTETSSEMFFWIKWLDSRFLFLLFVLSLVFSLSFILSWLLSLLFVFMVWLLFFRLWIFFIAGNISPKSLWNKRIWYFWLLVLGVF